MIVSKPKPGILFPVAVFLAMAYALVIFTLINFLSAEVKAIYQYAILIVISPIALGVTAKVLLDYKIIRVGKERISFRYPFRFTAKAYKVSQIKSWQETTVEAGKNIFKELGIVFHDKVKIKLTKQEYGGYDQLHNYLKKKCLNKRLH